MTNYHEIAMNIQTLFAQALGIQTPWTVEGVEFDPEEKKLHINIGIERGSKFYYKDPETGVEGEYKLHDTEKKTWRHLNFFDHECYLHAKTPRIKTPEGKVRLVSPPWSGQKLGFTLLFEALIMFLCQSMPVNKIGELLNINDKRIWAVLEHYVQEARKAEDFSEVTAVGMDETSEKKGHNYISLFVDLNKKRTIFVADGKDNKTVIAFKEDLEEHGGKAENITDVSCDMSKAFIKGVSEQLPNAQITFDKFHIIKVINEGVDAVRREEVKHNPLLKKKRYIFLKNDENLTQKQKAFKEELKLSGLNIKTLRALNIREAFQQIYSAKTIEEFTLGLKKWYGWALRSQLPPMQKVAKTIKEHWDGIIRWKHSQLSNGILEGLNSVVQAAKRRGRGYKTKHLKTMVYLMTGKLNFHTLNQNIKSTHLG